MASVNNHRTYRSTGPEIRRSRESNWIRQESDMAGVGQSIEPKPSNHQQNQPYCRRSSRIQRWLDPTMEHRRRRRKQKFSISNFKILTPLLELTSLCQKKKTKRKIIYDGHVANEYGIGSKQRWNGRRWWGRWVVETATPPSTLGGDIPNRRTVRRLQS